MLVFKNIYFFLLLIIIKEKRPSEKKDRDRHRRGNQATKQKDKHRRGIQAGHHGCSAANHLSGD